MMIHYVKKCLAVLMCVGLYIASAGSVFAGDRDVFVFIGQSNMAGRTPFLPGDYGVAGNADLLTPTGVWTPASNLSLPDPVYSLPANHFGFNRYSNVEKTDKPQLYTPGLALANAMARLRPNGNRLGLVFNARGATTVADWQMGAAPLDPSWGSGNLFYRTLDRLLVGGIKSSEIRGLIIDIGVSDALYGTSPEAYLAGLRTLVADVRSHLGLPNLQVFVGQQPYMRPEDYADYSNPNAPRDGYRLNAALSQWAAEEPLVHVICSGGAGLLSHVRPDTSHFDHAGMDQMGAGYARAIAEHVYGQVPGQVSLSAANFSPDPTCADALD